jgi:ribosomal protein S18 acetylase RimI-like enzyme
VDTEPAESQVSLRPARATDAPRIRDLVVAAYEPYVHEIGVVPRPMSDDYDQVVATRSVTVAEHAGDLVGLLVLHEEEGRFVPENVAVHPEQQGTGLGRRLLDLAEERAREAGHAAIDLFTHERMTRNIAIYERRGYVQVDRRTEDGRTRVFLRKRLDREGSEADRTRGR